MKRDCNLFLVPYILSYRLTSSGKLGWVVSWEKVTGYLASTTCSAGTPTPRRCGWSTPPFGRWPWLYGGKHYIKPCTISGLYVAILVELLMVTNVRRKRAKRIASGCTRICKSCNHKHFVPFAIRWPVAQKVAATPRVGRRKRAPRNVRYCSRCRPLLK